LVCYEVILTMSKSWLYYQQQVDCEKFYLVEVRIVGIALFWSSSCGSFSEYEMRTRFLRLLGWDTSNLFGLTLQRFLLLTGWDRELGSVVLVKGSSTILSSERSPPLVDWASSSNVNVTESFMETSWLFSAGGIKGNNSAEECAWLPMLKIGFLASVSSFKSVIKKYMVSAGKLCCVQLKTHIY